MCWFEIPATDFERAVRFYSGVLRINIQTITFMGVAYGVFQRVGEHAGGAIVPVKDQPTTGAAPVIFFKVNDMTSALDAVTRLGGKIITPKTIMRREGNDGRTMIPETLIDNRQGYFAVISDTEGNKIALYSNA